MGALSRTLIGLALAVAAPARADPLERWRGLIEQASLRFGIPARWIEQVIRAESGGYTALDGRPIRSRAGAIGLMQLMPATWASMRARLDLGTDPDDPHDNILAGSLFLRLMYDRFGYPGLFAAYNAGPALYARHLAGGAPLPVETRAYLAKIAGPIGGHAPVVPPPPALFVVRHDGASDAGLGKDGRPSLFAVRSDRP